MPEQGNINILSQIYLKRDCAAGEEGGERSFRNTDRNPRGSPQQPVTEISCVHPHNHTPESEVPTAALCVDNFQFKYNCNEMMNLTTINMSFQIYLNRNDGSGQSRNFVSNILITESQGKYTLNTNKAFL